MAFIVKTYLDEQEVKSENIKIQNKLIYGVLNKYIRTKEGKLTKEEKYSNNVVDF